MEVGIAIGVALGIGLIVTAGYYAFLRTSMRRKNNRFSVRFQRTLDNNNNEKSSGIAGPGDVKRGSASSGSSTGSKANLMKTRSKSLTYAPGAGRVRDISVPVKPSENIITPAQVYLQPEDMIKGEFREAMTANRTESQINFEAPLPPDVYRPNSGMYRGTETTRNPDVQYDELDVISMYAPPGTKYSLYPEDQRRPPVDVRSSSPTLGRFFVPKEDDRRSYVSPMVRRSTKPGGPKSQIFF